MSLIGYSVDWKLVWVYFRTICKPNCYPMYSIDVTEENFQTEVIEKSKSVPVLVDFWAEWCQPCQMLKPVLEALAEEYKGKFILAKVNADANQQLAAHFGVRGIPSVKAIYDGKTINEFSGVLPEAEVRKFLDLIIPNESEKLRLDAITVLESGDIDAALALLDKAIASDASNFTAQIDKAEICVNKGDFTEAETLLTKLPLAAREGDTRIDEIETRIDVGKRSQDLPDKDFLLASVEKNPGDLDAKLNLANLYIAEQNFEPALELLFDIIRQDRHFSDDVARKTVLEIFTLMGPQSSTVRDARRKLASLLN